MKKKIGTTVSLTKKQICFLDRISKDSKFSGGRKLSRTSIIRALLISAKELQIDVPGIQDEKELTKILLLSFKNKD